MEPVTDFGKSHKAVNSMGNGHELLKNGKKNGLGQGGGVRNKNRLLKNGGKDGFGVRNGNGLWMDRGANGFAAAGVAGGVMGKSGECCLFHGFWCTRCCWLIFLLGLLLGALITGLITGLVLGAQLEGK